MSKLKDLERKLEELQKDNADIGAYKDYGEVTKALLDEIKSLSGTVESLKSDLRDSDKDKKEKSIKPNPVYTPKAKTGMYEIDGEKFTIDISEPWSPFYGDKGGLASWLASEYKTADFMGVVEKYMTRTPKGLKQSLTYHSLSNMPGLWSAKYARIKVHTSFNQLAGLHSISDLLSNSSNLLFGRFPSLDEMHKPEIIARNIEDHYVNMGVLK
jgi:hypothetical protein